MSLRIQTNVSALNTHRQLLISNQGLATSLERLSSGFRINRAADDAAGLAIAGKLRTNVKSYLKAAQNTAQAVSMVQVAEGAMDQIENIVNRLKELATQAASTNTDSDGRARLNSEFSDLVDEIDRIAKSTKYGDTELISGTFGATVSATTLSGGAGVAANSSIVVSGHIGSDNTKYTIVDTDSLGITLHNGTSTQTITMSATGAQTLNFSDLGVKITLDSNYNDDAELNGTIITVAHATQYVQVGTANSGNDRITLSFGDMTKDYADWAGNAIQNWDINTVATAQYALGSIDTAIEYVTEKRADIGATQNRLGYASANLSTTIENLSAAESTIRDVDMAYEMTDFTKNQILLQAGTAMLAQANMTPQTVLQLIG